MTETNKNRALPQLWTIRNGRTVGKHYAIQGNNAWICSGCSTHPHSSNQNN